MASLFQDHSHFLFLNIAFSYMKFDQVQGGFDNLE